MLQLVIPNISHKEQWEEVMVEWGNDWRKNPRIFFQDSYEEFLILAENIKDRDDLKRMIPKSSVYFLFENTKLIGMYWIRHNLNYHDDATNGGHIGYGIRPSERGKGHGTQGLALALEETKKLGFGNVFISCDDDNLGSIKIIEANGGILIKTSIRYERKSRRYQIDLYKQEKATLESLEIELLHSGTRHNQDRINVLLADDFFECGKFGHQFGKKECLDALPNEDPRKILEPSNMTVHMLGENIGQVRFLCTIQNPGEPPTTSYRNSLWRKTENGWQMFFHQGTLIQIKN